MVILKLSSTCIIRVDGDSMMPRYNDGQIAWVQETRTLYDGDIGIFVVDGDAFIKQFKPVPPDEDVSYVVVTKAEEESVIEDLRSKLEVPLYHGHGDNWAGLTLPGYKGTAVIIRQNGLHGKQELKYVLWHEMGHAFAFEHESDQNFWATPTPAYMVWAEFIADMIGNKIAMTTGNPIPITAAQHLQDTFKNGKISVGSIGHFCSATQHIVIPTGTPEPMVRLSEMFRERMKEKEFWKINQTWLDRIMEQLELLRKPATQ